MEVKRQDNFFKEILTTIDNLKETLNECESQVKNYLITQEKENLDYQKFNKKEIEEFDFDSVVKEIDSENTDKNYLKLVIDILKNGDCINDRTTVGTKVLFDQQLKFDLRNENFPLLTTKKMDYEKILKELLWFLSGSSDAAELSRNNVKIWNKNAKDKYERDIKENSKSIKKNQFDVGPSYGFQWRHSGAEYEGSDGCYEGKGVDQIKRCIDLLINEPFSRKNIVSAWNVKDLNQMALEPCHFAFQCHVNSNYELSITVTQRSADVMLGLPYNIASYSILLRIFAKLSNLKPGNLTFNIGNAHIYTSHISNALKQIKNKSYNFPILKLSDLKELNRISFNDFRVLNYKSHDSITYEMIV